MHKSNVFSLNCYQKAHLEVIVNQAKLQNIEKIFILEPTYKFYECEALYYQIRSAYKIQNEWYLKVEKCSILEYQNFIDEMKKIDFDIDIQFGLLVQYSSEYEYFIEQIKKQYSYDLFVGCIDFIDNIIFDSMYSSNMLWEKYSEKYIFLRYYEMVFALISSKLFDGIAHFDTIQKVHQYRSRFMIHHYRKCAMHLHLNQMFVIDSYLLPRFLNECNAFHVEIK